MVCSGVVGWEGCDGRQRVEPLVFPPRELATTSAACVGSGLVTNLEHLFGPGMDMEQFIAKTATVYRVLSLLLVGDAATSNRKAVSQLIPYCVQIAAEHDLVLTMSWSPCFLHQLARVLLIHLEHQKISSALYSISRLHQHSETRKNQCLRCGRFSHRSSIFNRTEQPQCVLQQSPTFASAF